MSQAVVIKSNKYGIQLFLDPEMPFADLLQAIIEKFEDSARFFRDAKLAVGFEGRELTQEEIFCIRWHMGAFDDKENWNSYGRACTVYPNVLYTHTADMIAARIEGV